MSMLVLWQQNLKFSFHQQTVEFGPTHIFTQIYAPATLCIPAAVGVFLLHKLNWTELWRNTRFHVAFRTTQSSRPTLLHCSVCSQSERSRSRLVTLTRCRLSPVMSSVLCNSVDLFSFQSVCCKRSFSLNSFSGSDGYAQFNRGCRATRRSNRIASEHGASFCPDVRRAITVFWCFTFAEM